LPKVLVAEQYFNGFDANDFWNIKSASKSVLSVLIGIAIDEGYIESIHEPIAPYFPEYFEDRPVTDKNLITLQDLITMRSGLETTSNRNYGRWVTSRNWVLWALNQPLIREPGTSMIYSTGNSHLLSVILTRATGMSSLAFAREHLFEPLDINRVIWPRDPQGNYFGGNNMMFRPRDMLKIGHLYLNGGRYNGEQVVPISWVKESIGQYGQSRWSRHWQGYHWWTNWFDGYRTSFAWGHGGQFIFVVPNLDLVVVFTSSLTDRPDNGMNHNRGLLTLLEQYIIPAVIHGKAPLAASDMSAREVLR